MALIEREAVIEALKQAADHYSHIDECTEHSIRQCISTIKKIPTIDPIRAAGGCRCGECRYRNTCDHTVRIVPGGPGKGCLHGNLHGCEYGEIGEPREVQDDG